MSRALSSKNLLDKKYKTFPFEGIWKEIFGTPETNGIWIIYGREKNGKTWGALLISNYLSRFAKVLYVSAEEGTGMAFQNAWKRAKIESTNKKLQVTQYETVEEIYHRLKQRKAPKVIVLDNMTVYNDVLRAKGIKQLMYDHPNTTIICVAHEERNEPYTATAQMANKLASVIIRVKGLVMEVGGRVPGGTLLIDEQKAMLYHGSEIKG